MRLRIIMTASPSHTESCLVMALELESYQLASKQKARFVKEIQQSITTSKGTVASGDILQQLVVALENCCKDFKAPA